MTEVNSTLPDEVRRVLDDPSRLQALAALEVFGTGPDADFDRIARLAAHIFGAEIALVTLIDSDRQWFRASHGTDLTEMAPGDSFCAHVLAGTEAMVVLDAAADPRFMHNAPVTGEEHVRFYAGAPIVVAGQRLGSLCVIGRTPRAAVEPGLLDQLTDLAGLASTLFALKDEARVRARTAAALLKEEWRHALTLEAGNVGSWIWDIRTGEVVCNDMFRRMYQLPESGPIQFEQVLHTIHPSDRPAIEESIRASLEEGVDFIAEVRAGETGQWRTMRGRVYQRDAEGRALIMMGASTDITEAKQSADHTRLLLRELNHRVKNTLAMIQSVARQTIRQNPDPKAFMEAFSGRLRTISDAHVLLANRDWSGVHLYEVIASQLGPDFLDHPDRAEVRGPDMMLPADHAVGLGLILHELTTNAHRHGAWSTDQGIVNIEWEKREEPVPGLILRWRETDGPKVAPPRDYGLGTRLIERSLAKVLDSNVKLEFDPGGVAAEIWMPLPSEQD
ncbi:histidine kinase [Devosia yakushimensis]|uniref:Blue-light-activated histidine kinase n=1 Tax=Devosia yakushimensis TaxID=470028 RepID=A0ABQ5U8D3_9HYPH|nr:HWE histidine kinase domain-containing protein [Devosia yakushimensis]GLQ08385.1 histidine kinase [Devosia yakushimensis]